MNWEINFEDMLEDFWWCESKFMQRKSRLMCSFSGNYWHNEMSMEDYENYE